MAILTVNETFKDRAPNETFDGRTYIRTFEVTTDDPTTCGYDIFEHASIPNPGDPHNVDTNANCIKITPRPKSEDGCFWLVVVEYTTSSDGKATTKDTNTDVDPCDLPPDISFGFNQFQVVVDRAYEGPTISGSPTVDTGSPTEPIVNSAYQPFDPPVTMEVSRRVIRIVRNENSDDYNPDDLDEFNNTINLKKITIGGITLAVGEGRIRNIPAVMKYKNNGDVYFTVTYEIEVNRETHNKVLLDRGFYEIDKGTGDYSKITDDEGDLVSEPVMLDGNGSKLSNPSSDDAVYRYYRVFKYKDWDTLKLPVDDGGDGVDYSGYNLGGLGNL